MHREEFNVSTENEKNRKFRKVLGRPPNLFR